MITTMFSGNVNFSGKSNSSFKTSPCIFFQSVAIAYLGRKHAHGKVNRDHTRSIVNIIYVIRNVKINLYHNMHKYELSSQNKNMG